MNKNKRKKEYNKWVQINKEIYVSVFCRNYYLNFQINISCFYLFINSNLINIALIPFMQAQVFSFGKRENDSQSSY